MSTLRTAAQKGKEVPLLLTTSKCVALPNHSFHITNPTHLSEAYSSLIPQCTVSKSLTHLRAIHSHMITSGYTRLALGHVSMNKLLQAYVKCGGLADARNLFDELPSKHIVSCNSIISSHIAQGKCKEAVYLFQGMLEGRVLPDEYTLSSIFKAFSNLGLVSHGLIAHGLSVVSGLETSNSFVASALVDTYAKFGRMYHAQLVLDRVVEKDVVLFTSLIVGYAQHGHHNEALELFGNMVNGGIKANEYTLSSVLTSCGNLEDLIRGKLIHGLVIKSGFQSFTASQTSVLTMYSKCGLVEDSLEVFSQLSNANQVTWTSLIVGLVQHGREENALSVFREMTRASVIPNSFTLSSILQACSSLTMLEGGKQIHAVIMKLGVESNKYIGAALIDFYGKCGNAGTARSVFDALVEIDLVSVNTLIYAYAQNGFGHEALQLFERMKDLGIEPNDVTYLSVLLACNSSGLVEEGCQIFASIGNNSNVELKRDHYACMVDLLGRSKRLEEAQMLIEKVRNPDVVLWRTLLSACKIHGEVEMAEKVLRRVFELAPRDEGTYFLLSNLYASTGNWDQVVEIKSAIKELKLKRSPAMSWIDVDREVHTFMAGEWAHPKPEELSETLHKLIEKVKPMGYVPDTRFVLQDLNEEKKVWALYYHSEKLAIAFALWKTGGRSTSINVFKNLRVCGDCHTWIKLVSKLVRREIIVRDAKRFHHFKDGFCSCRDYW